MQITPTGASETPVTQLTASGKRLDNLLPATFAKMGQLTGRTILQTIIQISFNSGTTLVWIERAIAENAIEFLDRNIFMTREILASLIGKKLVAHKTRSWVFDSVRRLGCRSVASTPWS